MIQDPCEFIHNTPASHLECVLVDQKEEGVRVKQEAFLAMKELEGWCSEYKASILIDLVLAIEPQIVVEIGVFGGKSLVPMAFALKANRKGLIYGIDPWNVADSIQNIDGVHKDWWGAIDHTAIMNGLIQKIHQFGLQDYIHLYKTTSEEAEPIHGIDILHIDGNHSEAASYLDVVKWTPLVNKGGIIIFDDITRDGWTSKAVNWLDEHCIKQTEIVADNIWGIWIKP